MQFSVDLFRTLNINRYRFVNFSQKNKKQQPSLCNVVKIVQFVLKLCVVVAWKENSNPVVSLSRNFRSDLSRLPGALFIFLETWWTRAENRGGNAAAHHLARTTRNNKFLHAADSISSSFHLLHPDPFFPEDSEQYLFKRGLIGY